MILTEAGRFGEALARLEENSTSILDRLAYFEIRGFFKEIKLKSLFSLF